MTETFLEHLRRHFSQTDESFRQKGWQKFVEIGLPTKTHDAFRYVPLRELYAASFQPSENTVIDKSAFLSQIFPECAHSHIVFVDGTFSAILSDISALSSHAVLLAEEAAMRSHGSFLQSHLSRSLKEENDPFALLNLALHSQGAFFYLPPKIEEKTPLQILHVITGKSQLVAPRIYLTLGAKSQLSCISSSYCLDGAHFILPTTEIMLEEDAVLKGLSISDKIAQAWQMETVRAVLKKNARFASFAVTTGAKAVRQNVRVQLKGENSEADLSGLWLLDKNRTAHFHTTVDHEAPHTRSMQLFKGVLKDAAQSSFEGKILVRDAAQKTEAYQLNNNLLLSPGAIANSKPNLEVFADDVKASHGATVSQLDEEQLFYMKTRGIGEGQAKRLLVGGFCRQLLDSVPYPSVLKKLQQRVETFVERS